MFGESVVTMTNSEKAASYIMTHCRNIGSFEGDDTPCQFLAQVAEEMAVAEPTSLFPNRYKEHVACAVRMVARHPFRDPRAAIAAVYLATRFEFFFRLLSGKLNADGTWINQAVDQPAAVAALGKKGLGGNRVSSVEVTYKLMQLYRLRPAAQVFASLDKSIFPSPITVAGGDTLADIGDRIGFMRHSASHGYRGDISSEAVFYGCVAALVFYNQG
jgi:hypothetical protein